MYARFALYALRFAGGRRSPVPVGPWITLGFGLRLLLKRQRSLPGSLLSTAVGIALVARAFSGRNGLADTTRGDVPRVPGRHTTAVDGTVVASAADAAPARALARPPA